MTTPARPSRRGHAPTPLAQIRRRGYESLAPGCVVGVVAPAGPAAPERLALVAPMIEVAGLRARIYPGCALSSGYLAGDDDARLADLHAAFADDDVAAILCLRGGYGAMRLLDRIDLGLVRAHPKLVIGYSDITALHALLAYAGLPSLHAPMAASDLVQGGGESDRAALFALLQRGLGAGARLASPLDAASASAGLRAGGVAEGPLVGGNLSLVTALLGTRWAWRMNGAILFLEEVGEEPYRIDRCLTQLRLAGALDAAAGFVLGSFTQAASPAAVLREVLLAHCERSGKPLVGGWPAGHGTPNLPLPLGLRVRLDGDAGAVTLRQSLLRPAAS